MRRLESVTAIMVDHPYHLPPPLLESCRKEEEGRLGDELARELIHAVIKAGQLVDENDRMQPESAWAWECSAQERERTWDAEEIAMATEGTRDGLLRNYVRLTEENV